MKKVIAAAAAVMMLAQPVYAAHFNDTNGHWAEQEIDTLAERGIVNGVAEGWFEPEGEVTRAQYLKMIMETVGIGTVDYRRGQCLDADGNDWYAPYLQSALDKGLIPEQMVVGYRVKVNTEHGEDGSLTGSSVSYSGAFNGDVPITREESAFLMMSLYQYTLNPSTMNKFSYDTSKVGFKDDSAINRWTMQNVKLAAANGIITGMEDGSFRPLQTTTRAQSAVMLNRLIKLMEGKKNG